MKIIYIYTALLTKGGADRVLTGKANYLAEHGYDVGIITDSQMGRPPVFPLSSMVKLINLDIDFAKEYGHSFPPVVKKRAALGILNYFMENIEKGDL